MASAKKRMLETNIIGCLRISMIKKRAKKDGGLACAWSSILKRFNGFGHLGMCLAASDSIDFSDRIQTVEEVKRNVKTVGYASTP